MPVIIKPAPRPNPITGGLREAAEIFSAQKLRDKERAEREKVVLQSQTNEFLLKAIEQAPNPDILNRTIDAYEKNNELPQGYFPPAVRASFAAGADVKKAQRDIETAQKKAETGLVKERQKQVSAGVLSQAAADERAKEEMTLRTEASTRAERTATQQIEESKERVRASQAKREAGPKEPKPTDVEKQRLAQSNIDFFDETDRTRQEYVAFFGSEAFDPNTAGPGGGPMTDAQVAEHNKNIEKFKLPLAPIEKNEFGLYSVLPGGRRRGDILQKGSLRAPAAAETPEDRLKRLKSQAGVN
jgi:hypothetical protein